MTEERIIKRSGEWVLYRNTRHPNRWRAWIVEHSSGRTGYDYRTKATAEAALAELGTVVLGREPLRFNSLEWCRSQINAALSRAFAVAPDLEG